MMRAGVVVVLWAVAARALVPPAPRLGRPAWARGARPAAVAAAAAAAAPELYRATLDDLGDIVDVAHAEFGAAYGDPVSRFGLRTTLLVGFFLRLTYGLDADHAVFCARERGALTGVVELSLQPFGRLAGPIPPPQWLKAALGGADRPLRPYLSNLLVVPAKRRRGVGAALVGKCEAEAARWGFSTLALHHDRDDAPLARFYRKFGFRVETGAPAFLVDGFMLQFVSKPLGRR
jgi:GNAT superfamily N-acetyltransferase